MGLESVIEDIQRKGEREKEAISAAAAAEEQQILDEAQQKVEARRREEEIVCRMQSCEEKEPDWDPPIDY